jgi:fructokinase
VEELAGPYPRIVCLGEILIDLFPAELGRKLAEVSAFRPKPGGAPANVAVAIARLGISSAFIGKVGDDAFGHQLIQVLKEQGVETRGMRVGTYARTTLAFIAQPDAHTAEFVFYRNPGADLNMRINELDIGLLTNCQVLHIGSLSLVDQPARGATQRAASLAREAGALISFDVNYRPSLWDSKDQAIEQIWGMIPQGHLLKVNEVELGLLAEGESIEGAAQTLLEHGPELVVVTLGARGSFFCTRQAGEFVPAFQVETIDSTGCGDAFIAGLLTQLVDGQDWREKLAPDTLRMIMRRANAVGAITALRQGVIPALPTACQVEEFLRVHDAG